MNTSAPQSSSVLFLWYIYVLYIYSDNNLCLWLQLLFTCDFFQIFVSNLGPSKFWLPTAYLCIQPYIIINSGSVCVHSCIALITPVFLLLPISIVIPIDFRAQARNLDSTLVSLSSFKSAYIINYHVFHLSLSPASLFLGPCCFFSIWVLIISPMDSQ